MFLYRFLNITGITEITPTNALLTIMKEYHSDADIAALYEAADDVDHTAMVRARLKYAFKLAFNAKWTPESLIAEMRDVCRNKGAPTTLEIVIDGKYHPRKTNPRKKTAKKGRAS